MSKERKLEKLRRLILESKRFEEYRSLIDFGYFKLSLNLAYDKDGTRTPLRDTYLVRYNGIIVEEFPEKAIKKIIEEKKETIKKEFWEF